jgi:hypothetical protein
LWLRSHGLYLVSCECNHEGRDNFSHFIRLAYGANIDTTDNKGYSPLQTMMTIRTMPVEINRQIVLLLLNCNCNILHQDNNQNTVAHLVAVLRDDVDFYLFFFILEKIGLKNIEVIRNKDNLTFPEVRQTYVLSSR